MKMAGAGGMIGGTQCVYDSKWCAVTGDVKVE